mgnify:CR=1 FL=1
MKQYLDIILLVEGQHDKAKILSLFDCEIIVLNGYEIKEPLLKYLENVKDKKKIAILVDPDKAGIDIRNKLLIKIPYASSLNVDINKCDYKNKHGIAECDNDELIKILQPFIINKRVNTINKQDLFDIGLIGNANSKFLRHEIALHFNAYNDSTDTLLFSLNSLNLDKDKIWKYLVTIL